MGTVFESCGVCEARAVPLGEAGENGEGPGLDNVRMQQWRGLFTKAILD